MANQISKTEGESDVSLENSDNEEQATDNAELERRLNNWANERSRKVERRIRSYIAKAMTTDLRPASDPKYEPRVKEYKGWVEQASLHTIWRLSKLYEELKSGHRAETVIIRKQPGQGDLIVGLREIPSRGEQVVGIHPDKPNMDSETGEQFLTRIVREPNAWVAEEVRQTDGSYISQVRLYDDKRTPEMSLSFTGPRYLERDAEIRISPMNHQKFPTGASAVFTYLAGSIGQAEWHNLTHMKLGLRSIPGKVASIVTPKK